MNYITIGILGIIVGSFLNVCIYRIPREESISYPPSHCGSCNHKLGILDLFPVFSYIFLKGRCRYCNEKISIRYPSIELLNGILYMLIYHVHGMSIDTPKYCILSSLLIVVAIIDFTTQYVYTSTSIFGIAVGLAFCVGQSVLKMGNFKDLLLGAIIGGVIIGLIVITTKGMGEGDIEIAAVCGLFLGIKGVLVTLFLGIVIAGIIGIIILMLKMKKAKDMIAFGPFLSLGAIMYILYGNQLVEMYLKYVLHM